MNRNCDSAFVEARFDPRRILKDGIQGVVLDAMLVEARFDPRRILKVRASVSIPFNARRVEARFDPRRILKVKRPNSSA